MSSATWPDVLSRLSSGDHLDEASADWAMAEIMAGNADPAQLAAFAVLLRSKGETSEEIAAIAGRMLAETTRLDLSDLGVAVDIVGTGGDGSNSVNISTMAAIVVASSGVPVIKHGNRSASSTVGSADLLEALGVDLEATAERVEASVREVGIGFCFARTFHPGMRHAGPIRAALGIPTVFNLLGPLTNPGQPQAGLIGCADPVKAPLMAQVFAARGASVFVVRGDDGLDEISTSATTSEWIASGGRVSQGSIDAEEFGLVKAGPEALKGGDLEFNMAVARGVFAGELGPVRDAVLINAAAAMASRQGLIDGVDLHDVKIRRGLLAGNLELASKAIDEGAATALVERWAEFSRD
ncbi:anthranilate phosphoribosyltransferase [Glycomyces harbinensis]|uniref:Anthranilate phosphoribosyltransferase n=1 Tax=Glycomyces harbinensis TaxID=58114 RepID=A0A1G7A3H0_9ACTN|nr:anthranilate phosphoribosyltransferase [Glycomyces harbinensis]SDE09478.1 anthranilate phosphoribosyltransferase [Glycomyces harbinensis]